MLTVWSSENPQRKRAEEFAAASVKDRYAAAPLTHSIFGVSSSTGCEGLYPTAQTTQADSDREPRGAAEGGEWPGLQSGCRTWCCPTSTSRPPPSKRRDVVHDTSAAAAASAAGAGPPPTSVTVPAPPAVCAEKSAGAARSPGQDLEGPPPASPPPLPPCCEGMPAALPGGCQAAASCPAATLNPANLPPVPAGPKRAALRRLVGWFSRSKPPTPAPPPPPSPPPPSAPAAAPGPERPAGSRGLGKADGRRM